MGVSLAATPSFLARLSTALANISTLALSGVLKAMDIRYLRF